MFDKEHNRLRDIQLGIKGSIKYELHRWSVLSNNVEKEQTSKSLGYQ